MRYTSITLAIAALMLSACGSDSSNDQAAIDHSAMEDDITTEENAAPAEDAAPAVTFAKGEYSYKSDAAGDYKGCTASEGKFCADAAQWQALCKAANISQYAAESFWGGAWMHARNAQAVDYLVKNGGTSEISVSWADNLPRTSQKCLLQGTVSGMYNGSQVQENVLKFVTGFNVLEDGTILIVDTMNDGTI